MNIRFIERSEKDRIIEKLKEQYGISELPYLLIMIGKEKIRAYSGSLSKVEIMELGTSVNVELIGTYLLRIEKDGIRLSHDATSLLKDKITKSIIELDDTQASSWLKGNDIFIENTGFGYFVLRNKGNLIGCGKLSQGRIVNFVPKERRIKS
jgi:NOL1/NOP2/fmu family ribosome biogenesis protein